MQVSPRVSAGRLYSALVYPEKISSLIQLVACTSPLSSGSGTIVDIITLLRHCMCQWDIKNKLDLKSHCDLANMSFCSALSALTAG